jgi:protein-histidine pros-kinase
MRLSTKFNLMLAGVFAAGLGASGYISYRQLNQNAQMEVLANAGVLMETIMSAREWAVREVGPNLRENEDNEFLMMGVPAYAANKIFEEVKRHYPEYNYREVALNPMSPKARPVEWELDIVNAFRNDGQMKDLWGIRQTPSGPALYLARPFQIKQSGCLGCHTTPEKAPQALVKQYGTQNGYGWKLNETIGAQIVSVPMAVPLQQAQRSFLTFMGALSGVFAVVFLLLNLMLAFLVTRPLDKMAKAADQISRGDLEIGEFAEKGNDEVAMLGLSFNRMRRSLEKAMSLFDKEDGL